MQTRLYEFVMEHLGSTRLSRAEIAEGSGVPISTLNKIAQRNIENPGVQHVQALADYFSATAKVAA